MTAYLPDRNECRLYRIHETAHAWTVVRRGEVLAVLATYGDAKQYIQADVFGKEQ